MSALLLCFAWVRADDGWNPANPAEPYVTYAVVASSSPASAGTVSGGGTYLYGQSVSLTASPVSAYTFGYWTLNGNFYSSSRTVSYVVGDSAVRFVAHFEAKQQVTVSASPAVGGTVSGGGLYAQGATASLSANPKTDYTFLYWTLNGLFYSDQPAFAYVVGDSAAAFVALFEEQTPEPEPYNPPSPEEPYTKNFLRLKSDPAGAATLTGGGSYFSGVTVNVRATYSSTNYVFDSWTLNGEYYSSATSFSYVMPDSSVTFVAHLRRRWQVTTSVEPSAAGSASGGGRFEKGAVITLTTSNNDGYIFNHWTLNGRVYSDIASLTYMVGDSAAAFVAHYDELYPLEPEPYNPPSPDDPLTYVPIYAQPPAGYYFVSWNDGNTKNPRLVPSGTEGNYTPVFELITFDINDTVEICQGEVYNLGDKRLTSSGVYKETLLSQLGADSVVTLNLIVNPAYHYFKDTTVYTDESYDFLGETLTQEGTYTKEYTTVHGCDSIYVLTLHMVPRTAVITFVDEDGTVLASREYDYGSTPVAPADPVKDNSELYSYAFTGWSPEITAVTETATYTANYIATYIGADTVVVSDAQTASELPIGPRTQIIVSPTGYLTIDAPLTTHSLTLQYGLVAHAQVKGISRLTADNVDIVMAIHAARQWFAFAVPFEVGIETGIYVNGSSSPARYGYDFIIDGYDGNLRASTQQGWARMASDASLLPGRMYMLYAADASSWRLVAKPSAFAETTSVAINAYPSDMGTHHSGWNGAANTLYRQTSAALSGVYYITTYNNALGVYEAQPMAIAALDAAQPFFVQVPATGTLIFASQPTNAPAHYLQQTEEPIACELSLSSDNFTDKAFISCNADKEDSYLIGHDLQKLRVSEPRVQQLWLEAYGLQLAAYEMSLTENARIIPIGMYAPTAGNYSLSITGVPAGIAVILTKDGQPVWNISESAALVPLNAGDNGGYALYIRRLPEVVTGLPAVATGTEVQKIIMDDKLYIIRDGKVYTVTGARVQ